MAPENVSSLLVLDLEFRDEGLFATRHNLTAGRAFLVKWYPLAASPPGFRPIAGGVLHVPAALPDEQVDRPAIERTHSGYRYQDDAQMLVAVLPPGTVLMGAQPGPVGAKVFQGRLAVYWLRGETDMIHVNWSIAGSDADPAGIASGINTAAERAGGLLPSFSLDGCEFYDVALSYASEDREDAARIALCLKAEGKHIFFDDDNEAMLWGKGLRGTLADIYGTRASYCLVLVSQSYKNKMWTNEERKAALKRAGEQRGREYILPVRLDGTTLEGLADDIVYVPMDRGAVHIASLLIEKMRRR